MNVRQRHNFLAGQEDTATHSLSLISTLTGKPVPLERRIVWALKRLVELRTKIKEGCITQYSYLDFFEFGEMVAIKRFLAYHGVKT